MLERLWSTWRATYVTGRPSPEMSGDAATSGDAGVSGDPDTSDGSVFTQILRSGLPDEETHIVHRGDTVFVIVNIHPYTSGHLLVLPYREVADLVDLTAEESTELWATVIEAVGVVQSTYTPDGMNVGLNLGRPAGGSVPTHLHMHVVPRWTGDSNFLSAIANTQTLPEGLDVTAARIRAAWPS